jgi:hypothetical protein
LIALIARSRRGRSALLASCIAACASSGVCADAYVDSRHAYTAGIVAVDVATPAAVHSPAEQASIPDVGSGEQSRLAALQWAEESRLATYLHLHYANEQNAVTLYPLAALAAVARRTGHYSRGSYRSGRYVFARRAAVGAGGAACASSCKGR